jgi:1,5-anhydro-D-fructose reductase (1,5-anhydro-D-mannitol-forming)
VNERRGAKRWGVIGTRGYAARSAAPGIAASREAVLAAVLGRDAEHTASFAGEHGAEPFTDLHAFLASGLDVVWIATPTWLHRDQTITALDAGLHVLCEKPLAHDAHAAWDMVDAAKAAGRVLATGYQGRYVPGHREMLRLISEGAIGDVTVARTYYGVHRPGPPPEWRTHRDTATWGALADIGTHHIDLLRMLLGEFADVRGLTGHQLGFETEDVAAVAFRFESGVFATLAVTVNVWAQQTRVEVHGTDGLLVAADTNPAGAGDVVLYDATHHEGQDVTGSKPDSLYALQVDAVSAATKGDNVPYATGEDGARTIDVLEAIGVDVGRS